MKAGHDDHDIIGTRVKRDETAGLSLFATVPPDGPTRKEAGMQQARDAEDVQRWRAAFVAAVEELAQRGQPFTSEDVTARVGLPRDSQQNRNSAVGAMMNALARRGVIRKTGRRVQSARPQSHSAEILEWEANAQRGAA